MSSHLCIKLLTWLLDAENALSNLQIGLGRIGWEELRFEESVFALALARVANEEDVAHACFHFGTGLVKTERSDADDDVFLDVVVFLRPRLADQDGCIEQAIIVGSSDESNCSMDNGR